MKKLLFIFLLFSFISIFSQNALQFVNLLTKDTLIIYERDKVNFAYFGYLQQEETIKGRIININDSIVTIANVYFGNYINKKQIKICDIVGVRKYSRLRQTAKFMTSVIVLIGSIVLPEVLVITSSLSIYVTTISCNAVGLLLTQIIFPNKIKKSKRTGWEIKILYPINLQQSS